MVEPKRFFNTPKRKKPIPDDSYYGKQARSSGVWGRFRSKIRKRKRYCRLCKHGRLGIAHHPDYGNPLTVIYVCWSCHRKIRMGLIDVSKHVDKFTVWG